jgi:hypothetical protein
MECTSCDIASLTSLIKEQECTIAELKETIIHLQSRITELEARLGLHSGNSSFPPSRDIVLPPKPVTLRKKSGRKAGGQKNGKA